MMLGRKLDMVCSVQPLGISGEIVERGEQAAGDGWTYCDVQVVCGGVGVRGEVDRRCGGGASGNAAAADGLLYAGRLDGKGEFERVGLFISKGFGNEVRGADGRGFDAP